MDLDICHKVAPVDVEDDVEAGLMEMLEEFDVAAVCSTILASDEMVQPC